MTYDTNSSWLDKPQGTEEQWVELISAHNPPDDVRDIVGKYFFHGNECGLNPDLALAQACIEAAYFTSARWRQQRNPCGLAITDSSVPGIDFSTIDNGIIAHYEHLMCYTMAQDADILANGTWPLLDTRHVFHDNIPQLFTLERPERRWAASGFSYVTNIAAIANIAINEPIPTMPVPVPPPVTFPTKDPVILKNDTYVNTWNEGDWAGRGFYPIRAIVLHVMAGSYAGSISWFHDSSAQASANYCISYDGEITETVDPNTQAPWANGVMNPAHTQLPPGLSDLASGWPNANWVTISIETEGHTADEGGYPHPNEYNAVVQLMAWLCKKYNLHPSEDTIVRHTDFDPINRPSCPGSHWDFPGKLIPDVIAAMNIPTPVNPNDPLGVESADGQYRTFGFISGSPTLGHSIYAYWRQDGVSEALWRYGYPLSNETTEARPDGSGVVCSWCERSRLEWHPEIGPNSVLEGLIGQEMLEYFNRWSVIANGAEYSPAAGPERTTLPIDNRIQSYYDKHGSLAHFGYPLTHVVKYPGEEMEGQWFERAFIEIHSDGLIVARRLGAEFIEARNNPKGEDQNTKPVVS